MSYDDYKEPENFKAIMQRAFEAIYAGHYMQIEERDIQKAQLATGGMIAAILEGLLPKKEPEVARLIDGRSSESILFWNILAYARPSGVEYFLFKASDIDWSHGDVDFSIRENVFGLPSDAAPLFVARLRYSLEKTYIIDKLRTESGREKLLSLSWGYGAIQDENENYELLLETWETIDDDDKERINCYSEEIIGKASLFEHEFPF